MTTRRKTRQLTDDESILWHQVSRTVTPLEKAREKSSTISSPPDTMAELLGESEGRAKPEPRQQPVPPAFRPPRKPPPSAPKPLGERIDRPTSRKIARGRLAIDARIDLHAMTQQQAHDRLYAFLADSRSRGLRHVLVVTGKGRSLGSEGALRQAVPMWLNGTRFSDLVSGYATAARHHGGEGAIYVRLRRMMGANGRYR